MPFFESKYLCIGYEQTTLIQNLSFTLEKGEIVFIRAPSGAGKSALFKTLAALIQPLSGQVLFEGKTPEIWDYPRWRSQVLYQPQTPIFGEGTVLDEWKKPFAFGIREKEFSPQEAEENLVKLGLHKEILHQKANSLSLGQKQRIAFLRNLSLLPKVWLLDEPTSALDVENKRAVEKLLQEALKQGMSCMMVSHDQTQISRLSGEVIKI